MSAKKQVKTTKIKKSDLKKKKGGSLGIVREDQSKPKPAPAPRCSQCTTFPR